MIETMINMAGAFRRHAAGPKFRPAAAMLACSLVTGAVGFGTGAAIGSVLIGDFIKGGGRIVPLLYRPSFQHIDAAAMLGSADDLKRLSGYYALLETGSVDVGFLVERYGMEKIRRETVYAPDDKKAGLLDRLRKAKSMSRDAWLERDQPKTPAQFVQIQPLQQPGIALKAN